MVNELTKVGDGVVSLIGPGGGIDNILKPLSREIHLFDTYAAGTSHIKDKSVFAKIAAGDKLTLVREENKFDDNAIVIKTQEGQKLGYVPEKDNIVFARLMDAGKLLVGKISSIENLNGFIKIAIGIYLVDF